MAAPKVRSLKKLIREQTGAIRPELNLIDQDIGRLEQSGQAQEAGLVARKDQEFDAIEQRAQGKGMLFSGFSPKEQADFTATSFLPALAQLQQTIAQGRSELLGRKAGLRRDVFNTATKLREGDVDRRFRFTERVSGQKFQAREAQKDRQFRASESEKERRFTASQNAANRAASAAASSAAAAAQRAGDSRTANAVADVRDILESQTGSDGYVHPQTYHQARSVYAQFGGDPRDFDNVFVGFANPGHLHDYVRGE